MTNKRIRRSLDRLNEQHHKRVWALTRRVLAQEAWRLKGAFYKDPSNDTAVIEVPIKCSPSRLSSWANEVLSVLCRKWPCEIIVASVWQVDEGWDWRPDIGYVKLVIWPKRRRFESLPSPSSLLLATAPRHSGALRALHEPAVVGNGGVFEGVDMDDPLLTPSMTGNAMMTPKYLLGMTDEEVSRTISQNELAAKALSEATGREIIFVNNRGDDATWGTWGRFVVKNSTPA